MCTQKAPHDYSQLHEKPGVYSFFRKPSRNKNLRKRAIEQDEDEDTKGTSLLSKVKKTSKADSVDESNNAMFQYESSKVIQVQSDNKATATLETETDFSRDARAIRERALKQAEEALKGKNNVSADGKLYKGMNGYIYYKAGFRREQTIASEKAGGAHGPLRASAHIRVSARFDYQPDICKDYKETGYCGYGDSCKFMHDRGDYKSGWQMEKEWEEEEKARKRNLSMGGGGDDDQDCADQSEDNDDDSLPFACFICRQPFVDAVVTKCKHYFCEHCALKHHMKNKVFCLQPAYPRNFQHCSRNTEKMAGQMKGLERSQMVIKSRKILSCIQVLLYFIMMGTLSSYLLSLLNYAAS